MTANKIIDELRNKIKELEKINILPDTPEYRLREALLTALEDYEKRYVQTHRVWFGG